jgi:hypothetical protein
MSENVVNIKHFPQLQDSEASTTLSNAIGRGTLLCAYKYGISGAYILIFFDPAKLKVKPCCSSAARHLVLNLPPQSRG